MRRVGLWLLVITAFAVGGCSLSSNVTVEPLFLLPSDIYKPSNLEDALERGDYRSAAEMSSLVEQARRQRVEQAALLGRAQFFCGRYAQARETLNRALEQKMSPVLRAQIEWDLAQVAYQQEDMAEALEYALRAKEGGISIKEWYIDFLRAIQDTDIHSIEGSHRAIVGFDIGSPDLPRIPVTVNGRLDGQSVLDSGAVMSIVSRSFAEKAGIRKLEKVDGYFYGLLGEPIAVQFGMIDSLRIREMTIRNMPVAIMDDSKLHFFVEKDEKFDIEFLIGTNLLKEFRLRFDYVRNILTLDFLEANERLPVSNQNLFMVDQRPLVHVTINQQGWYPFLLDTGSEVTFLNESRFSIQNITYGVPRYHGATMQGLGGAQKSGMRVKDVSIGLHRWAGRFNDMPLYTDERPGAVGILGQNYLQKFYVDVDFGRMRVELHRVGAGGMQE